MENVVFQSDLFFDVLDYSISHKVLLLRGTEIIESNGEYISHTNTDLSFGSTQYIQMPTWFEDGIKIIKGVVDIEANGRILLANKYFELHNQDNIYYIESYGMEILKNSLDTAESSIDYKKYRTKDIQSSHKIEDYMHHFENILLNLKTNINFYKMNNEEKVKYLQDACFPFSIEQQTLNYLTNLE